MSDALIKILKKKDYFDAFSQLSHDVVRHIKENIMAFLNKLDPDDAEELYPNIIIIKVFSTALSHIMISALEMDHLIEDNSPLVKYFLSGISAHVTKVFDDLKDDMDIKTKNIPTTH